MKNRKYLLIQMLALTLLVTSCSKGGIFGGILSGLSLKSINTPGGFSAYNPPVNSNMTEAKSNLSGADNDVALTLMSNAGMDKASFMAYLASGDPDAQAYQAILDAYGIKMDDGSCSTADAGIFVIDGSLSKPLSDAFVAPDNLVICPYSVSSSIDNVKNSLDPQSSSSFSALSVADKKDAETSLVEYLNRLSDPTAIDCNSGTFPSIGTNVTYDMSDYSVECQLIGLSSLVNGSTASGDSYLIYQRLHQRTDLKKSLELTVLNQMSTDDSHPKIMAFAQDKLNTDSTFITSMSQFSKKNAQGEFLQVSLNSFMAHGVNIFALTTYLGWDASAEMDGINGADKDKLHQLYQDNAFKIITTDKAKSTLFYANKPGFRFFVDMFIDSQVDAYDASGNKIVEPAVMNAATANALNKATLFRYYLNPTNFCKYVLQSQAASNSTTISTENMSSCLDTVTPYLDRLIVMHDMKDKLISFYYVDSPNIDQTKFLDFSYDYNYKSDIRVESNNFKNVVVAIAQRELVDHPDLLQEQNFDQSDINFLKGIEVSGKVFLADKIVVGTDTANRSSLADIGLSDLSSKVAIGVGDFKTNSTDGFFLRIPENLGSFNVGTGTNAASLDASSEGDVLLTLPKISDLLYLQHTRGNDIYKDVAGLNIPSVNGQFPPYQLTEQDLLVASFGIDEKCDPGSIPAGYTCDVQFKLTKPQFATGDANRLSKLIVKKFDLDATTGQMASTFGQWGLGLTPASVKFNAPVVVTNSVPARTANGLVVSPVTVWGLVRNNNDLGEGSNVLPLTLAPYVDGVSEFQVTSSDEVKVDGLGNGNILLKQDGSTPNIALDFAHMSLIDTNGDTTAIDRCSLPLPLSEHIIVDTDGKSVVSPTTVVTEVMTNIISAGYTSYPCI